MIMKKAVNIAPDKSLARYLADINKVKLLDADEELKLAKRIKNGDREALELLVNANLRFVVSVAKQFQNHGLAIGDLINEGNVGLIKAAKKFDETRGFKFISYAVWWIRQSIMQAITEQSRLVRLPLNRIAAINKVFKANKLLEQDYERIPNTSELAKELNINEDEVKFALEISSREVSFDSHIFQDNEKVTLLDVTVDTNQPSPDSTLIDASLKDEIKSSLAKLNEKESYVIKYSYGIGTSSSLTLEEMGQHLNLTRERVRQIREKALQKLRHPKNSHHLKKYLG